MMKKRAREEQHGVAVLGLGREETLWVFGSFCYVFFSLSRYSSVPLVQWRERTTEEGEGWCGRGLRSVDDVVAASTTASTSHDCTAEKKRHLHTLATQEHTNERMPPDERRQNKERRRKYDFVTSLLCRHVTVKPAFPLDAGDLGGKGVWGGKGWYGVVVAQNGPTAQQALLRKRKSSDISARIWRGFSQWRRFFSARF